METGWVPDINQRKIRHLGQKQTEKSGPTDQAIMFKQSDMKRFDRLVGSWGDSRLPLFGLGCSNSPCVT